MSAEEVTRRSSAWGRYLTLAAISAVVVMISLPRLREFALRENESDARVLVSRLAAALGSKFEPGPELDVAAEVRAAEPSACVADLVESADSLKPWLSDAEMLEDGKLLRRHGYLFDVARAPDRRWAVRAWPWQAGRTGTRAFVRVVGSEPLAHANEGARYSGPAGAPELEALRAESGWAGWQDADVARE